MENATIMCAFSQPHGRKKTGVEALGTATAESGMVCPKSGEWEIVGLVSTTAVFAEGQVMPEYYGRKVVWMLIREG